MTNESNNSSQVSRLSFCGGMNKRFVLTLYLVLWVILSAGIIFGMTRAGYHMWVAVAFTYLFFLFLNRSLTYLCLVKQSKLEDKKVPRYLKYLFRSNNILKFNEPEPRSTHVLVGAVVALAGMFFVFCGVALAFDAEWSRISQPFIAVTICLGLVSLGAALLYFAWRLFSFKGPPNDAA